LNKHEKSHQGEAIIACSSKGSISYDPLAIKEEISDIY